MCISLETFVCCQSIKHIDWFSFEVNWLCDPVHHDQQSVNAKKVFNCSNVPLHFCDIPLYQYVWKTALWECENFKAIFKRFLCNLGVFISVFNCAIYVLRNFSRNWNTTVDTRQPNRLFSRWLPPSFVLSGLARLVRVCTVCRAAVRLHRLHLFPRPRNQRQDLQRNRRSFPNGP